MAAIIDTAHRVVGKFGTAPYGESLDGFTSGNMAGGILPTELSADWCDGVQMELVNLTTQYLPFPLGGAGTYADLAYALDHAHSHMRPIWDTNPVFTFRSQSDSVLTTNGKSCVYSTRTQNNFSLAPSSVTNIGILAVPTNTQCLASFQATVTQTDAISTNYGQIEYRVSVRNSAGGGDDSKLGDHLFQYPRDRVRVRHLDQRRERHVEINCAGRSCGQDPQRAVLQHAPQRDDRGLIP